MYYQLYILTFLLFGTLLKPPIRLHLNVKQPVYQANIDDSEREP